MLVNQSTKEGTVFTLGYQLRQLPDFINLLLGAEIDTVIDVRQTPWSYRPGFSAKPLQEGLKEQNIGYITAKFAGNPKVLRTQAASHAESLELYAGHLAEQPEILQQLEDTMRPLLGAGKNVCLVCYERHPADCHRTILAYGWRDMVSAQATITHLDPDGAPRFTTFQTDSIEQLVATALQASLLGA
jgi:uncharacterized protein (DUF488 family)